MSGPAYEVIIVGGGQAGLALGYMLQQQGRRFVILDAGPEVGHSWRARWDSLTLFTPCPYDNLPGLPLPRPAGTFPTKDEVADYLRRYAATFALPVALGQRAQSLERNAHGFTIQTASTQYEAQQVVIATGSFQTPLVPAWGADLSTDVVQIHSSAYRNPQQIPPGLVLVIGAGNSGVQIAKELAFTRPVTLAIGRRLRHIPRAVAHTLLFWQLYFGVAAHLTDSSPLGPLLKQQDILFGNSLSELKRTHGIALVGRALQVANNAVRFSGGETVAPSCVIWATGFRPDYRWIKLPVCDSDGRPRQFQGLTAVPGLYFLGLFWQTWAGSSLLGGVGRDARKLAEQIEQFARPAR